MEITVCYLIIYIIEALILWQYCSSLFYSKYTKKQECIVLFLCYIVLFSTYLLESLWINLILFLLVNYIVIISLYRIKWHSALFHASLITSIMCLSELFILSLDSHFAINFYTERLHKYNLVILAIFSKLIYFLILRLVILISKGKKEKKMKSDFKSFSLNLIPIISTFIVVTLVVTCLSTRLSTLLTRLFSISAILLLVINLLTFWFYSYTQKKNYEFTNLALQLQKEYDSAEYYKMLLKQDEEQKILIHDIKNHLQSISALNEQGEQQKIAAYIDQIIHSPNLQNSVRICDNALLNAILVRYIHNCEEKKIALRADIRKGLLEFLTYDDLTALFCNLLDNAVEAASTIPDSYIDLSVTYHENASLTMLSMINSCQKNPFSEKTGKLLSHKQNPLRHGYGMKSVQGIVTKYHGEMQVYYDEKNMAFHTIITLKEP